MRLAVITPAHGRHDHLRRQQESLRRSERPADLRVVVAMDDDGLASMLEPDDRLVACERGPYGLPLARARNLGARTALDAGAELLVFLDVDCLVAPGTLGWFESAADPDLGTTLLTGATGYLPPPSGDGYDLGALPAGRFHPGRPRPRPGLVERAGPTLFWSLSFAVTAAVWERIGGFDEAYEGYGAEDTDFAMRADRAGVGLTFVGGAETSHQWHPASTPPVEHLDDLLRNGALFATRWGWWPMEGWFEQLREVGVVERDEQGWRGVTPGA